jgi:hypothetical protein
MRQNLIMMSRDSDWGPIPDGFERIVGRDRFFMVVRSDIKKLIDIQTWVDGSDTKSLSSFKGRERLKTVSLRNGHAALLRTYHHGGLFRKLTGRVFFTWPPRPFRELTITEEIRRRGIATVEVYAAGVAQLWGPFYQGWLVTRELKGALDLWMALQTGLARRVGVNVVLAAVARTLHALHREGVYHRDLNLKNILVTAEGDDVRGYIIDFDKAKLFLGRLPPELVRNNLQRLLRSVEKLDPQRRFVSRADWREFVSYYHAIE